MSSDSFSAMLATAPLPAFSARGEVGKVTICGTSHYVHTLQAVALDKPLQNFEPFNNLPLELKTKIWKFATAARVVIAFEVAMPAKEKSATDSVTVYTEAEKSKFKFLGASIPTIFQVCKEVMGLSGGIGYRPMFQLPGSSKALCFNPYIDTLDLRTAHDRANIADRLELSKTLTNPLDVQLIRHLRLTLPSFDFDFSNVIKDINAMTSLKVLHLSGWFGTAPTCPEFTLKLSFENLEGGGAIPVADIPGNRLVGDKVVSHVLSHSTGLEN